MKKKFLDPDFLLNTKTAQHLYHTYAEKTPILDYHCHINPKEIAENIQFENITKIWLGGDHYKWRLMRAKGIDEAYITGNADDREKFQKWAETLEYAYGNPLFAWSHMELKQYFGYEGVLNKNTAEEVWQLANEKLSEKNMTTKSLIANSGVKLICTTDDPSDSLEWHTKIKNEHLDNDAIVLPAFRPDKAVRIDRDEFVPYLKKLEEMSGKSIHSYTDLLDVLQSRIHHFDKAGCKAADHGIDYVPYVKATEGEIKQIFEKKLSGKKITEEESSKFQTAVLLYCAEMYSKLGWVMQLHFSCRRNNSSRAFTTIGPDTGYDCISADTSVAELSGFLNDLDTRKILPKTILYSLNPNDNALLVSLMGCFQGDVFGKIQHGAAWWFNDHKPGMIDQMTTLSSEGLFGSFIGMLTDSRSFLSYPRHEYFRRVLCNLLGSWVENGECPDDEEMLAKYVKGISYNNAVEYFGFPLEKA